MDITPSQPLQCLLTLDSACKAAPETTGDRNMKFAEEATFFASFFKDFSVRPMPDQPLMLMLYKFKLRRKQRQVGKKEKTSRLALHKKRDEPEQHSEERPFV